MEIGRGTISSVMGDDNGLVDLIPVDTVCNSLITAAWANNFMRASSNKMPIYNCTSGQFNPQCYRELGDRIVKYARINPSKYISMYPNFKYQTNRSIHRIYEVLLHFLPAFIFDIVLRVQGKKPIMLKIARRFKSAQDTGDYFVVNFWNFDAKNFKRMIRAANETQLDCNEFNCDVSTLDWDSYIEKYMMGIRTFVLKDDISSLPKARRRLKTLYLTKRFIEVFLLAGICLLFLYCLKF